MAKLSLNDVSGGYQLVTTYNANNTLLETALENTLSRDGTTPNTMSVALDMNSQLVTNIAVPVSNQDAASKKYVDDIVTGFTSSATFSAALPYDVTGSWDFEALASFEAGVRIYDTVDGSDYVAMVHDGTDFNITQVGTQEFTFPTLDGGGLGFYSFADQIHMLSSASINFYNAAKDEYVYMWHDGSGGVVDTIGAQLSLKSVSGTSPMNFLGTGYRFLEGATAAADVAGFGQLWVKSDAPNTFWFTDDTGVDQQLSRTFGNFTGTLTGYASGPTGTFYWSKEPLDGTHWRVTIWADPAGGDVSGTSNANTLTMTGIPAAINPTTNSVGEVPCIVYDGGLGNNGSLQISSSNIITFYMDPGTGLHGSTSFTTSGTKGLPNGWSATYIID